MRKRSLLLLFTLLAGSLALTPVTATTAADDDPFPVGVCAHVPKVHGKPVCVLFDPAA